MSGPSLLFTLPFVLTLLSPSSLMVSCRGTEVGNGKTDGTPGSAGGTTTSATPSSAESPDASGGADDSGGTEETMSETSTNAPNMGMGKIWLFTACASPFAENIEGTFTDASGMQSLTVTPGMAASKTVSWDNMTYQVTPAPSSGTFAISSEPQGVAVSCGPLQSLPTADGGMQRSVVLSNGVQVIWELAGGTVVKLTIHLNPQSPSLTLNKQ